MKSKKYFLYIHQSFLYLIYQERNSTDSFQQRNRYRNIIFKKQSLTYTFNIRLLEEKKKNKVHNVA